MTTTQPGGCLSILARLIGSKPSTTTEAVESFPYAVRDRFLSPAELSFYHNLTQAVAGRAIVLCKVRLADLLYVRQPQEHRSAFGKISQKHADFVLCAPRTMQPIAVVELDDSSHQRERRIQRDAFVDRALAAAGLPLIRIPAQRGYQLAEIQAALSPYIEKA
ncbi:DUF2726 domain-containing protein [Kallotenue papyrolyticum]|uniref:DUF2726 domain-containing protein n=1 Tax=Kallotenue papyrolyticum TaxID=1325125 RepID=UPI0012680B3F|nr:DUF2726 domain-containing protein [Kallotenue papyrolyticum]